MLQNDKTKQEFGYDAGALTKGSNRKIYIICDYCNQEYVTTYKLYLNSRQVVTKDACKKCKYKKREDVSMAKHGVKNSAQRPDVRKKMSKNCAFNQEGFKEKRDKTMLKKYGTTITMHNKELKQRQKDTVKEKYGVENVSQIPAVREKVEQTNLKKFGNKQFFASEEGSKKKLEGMRKKYGVDNAFQSEEIKEKIRQTNMDKYGVEYPTQSDEIMKKIEKTNIERYKVKNPLQNKEIQNKIKKSNIEKYGTEFPTQHPDVKAKTIDTNIKKYGTKVPTQNQAIKDKIIETKVERGLIKIIDNKDMHEWAKMLDKPYSTLIAQIDKFGFDKAIKMTRQYTDLEHTFKFWLDESGINYDMQFRVENKIADFYLKDHNILVEVDGLYWHSELFKPDDYHVNKLKLYEQHGYRAFFFREDEINNKFDIIQSILSNAMGKSNRIFARKCTIVDISKSDSKEFFTKNHLMGKGQGITYGLKYGDKIVSAIIIKRIKDKDYDISRFCNTLNTQVVGGFSKLIKHFSRQNSADNLQTFIDRRYGSGAYLTKLGFELKTCGPSFVWTNGREAIHRLRFRGNTGYSSGLIKLWDCGQARYNYI